MVSYIAFRKGGRYVRWIVWRWGVHYDGFVSWIPRPAKLGPAWKHPSTGCGISGCASLVFKPSSLARVHLGSARVCFEPTFSSRFIRSSTGPRWLAVDIYINGTQSIQAVAWKFTNEWTESGSKTQRLNFSLSCDLISILSFDIKGNFRHYHYVEDRRLYQSVSAENFRIVFALERQFCQTRARKKGDTKKYATWHMCKSGSSLSIFSQWKDRSESLKYYELWGRQNLL